nr:sigma 54-interacting transcriptional regulator [Trinickia dabaoshanensis]
MAVTTDEGQKGATNAPIDSENKKAARTKASGGRARVNKGGEQKATRNLSDYGHMRLSAMQSLLDVLERSSEGTLIVDDQARVVWVNEQYLRRFGAKRADEVIGMPCEEVIPNSRMREVVESGEPLLLDILEGEASPLVVMRLPIKDEHGETIGAIGFALHQRLNSLAPLLARYRLMQEQLASARESLRNERRPKYSFANFAGTSAATLELKRHARRTAATESPVLLLGETGTGKELLAHAIHAASPRAGKPFVSVNVAALPDTLLEAEFFGTAAGAYTGAGPKGRAGKFQAAQGGTLFLDEIGDMPLALQSKLLRVLQEKEFEPLGSNKVIHADVRVIAATSHNLHEAVLNGHFRSDLFYRLNVLNVSVPPLRARLDDMEVICEAIFDELCTHGCYEHATLSPEALAALRRHDWPGNVRELRNVLERALLAVEGSTLDADTIRTAIMAGMHTSPAADRREKQRFGPARYDEALAGFERTLIENTLAECGGRVAEAAKRLCIGRATLYKKMLGLGISTPHGM